MESFCRSSKQENQLRPSAALKDRKLKETEYKLDKMIRLNAVLQRENEVLKDELTALKVRGVKLLEGLR